MNSDNVHSIRSVNIDEERLKGMETILSDAVKTINEHRPKGLMIIFQDERDDLYTYKYEAVGLKNSEKVALLEFVKELCMRGL